MARFGGVSRIVGGASRRTIRFAALGIVTVAVAGGTGWYLTRDTAAPEATVETAQATRGTLATTVTLPGTASSTSSVALTFPVAGKIAEVNVVIGQTVKAGDPLARVDDTDARQALQTAQNNLEIARLKMAQLQAPMKPEDALASQQSVLNAKASLQSAQANLTKLTSPPTALDAAAADIVVLQAMQAVDQAARSHVSAEASLRVAQTTYCSYITSSVLPADACRGDSLPLSAKLIQDITQTVSFQTTLPSGAAQAATGLISANSSLLTAKQSWTIAQTSLDTAQAKRKQLDQPYTALDLQAAMTSVETATAAYNVAVAKAAALERGADALDLQSQQLAVRTQEIAVATAQQKVTDAILRAPFAGTVGAVPLIVGQQVGTSTAAVTLTDTGTIQVKMTLSESDLTQVRAGQLGLATFDALAGQSFVVRVIGVSPVPTVTQGVVTYAAQATILRGPELIELQPELQKLAAALSSGSARTGAVQIPGLGGGGPGAGAGGGANAAPGASATAAASASPTGSSTAAATAPTKGGGGQGRPAGAGAGPGAGAAGGITGAGGQQRLPSEGMSGSIILVQSVSENVLLVPSGAVRREGRQSVVLVPDGAGGTQSKPVVVGGTDGSRTVITSGLDDGAVVVTSAVRATGTPTGTARPGQNQAAPVGPGGPGGGGAAIR
jgi:HlyD family secretion protein